MLHIRKSNLQINNNKKKRGKNIDLPYFMSADYEFFTSNFPECKQCKEKEISPNFPS